MSRCEDCVRCTECPEIAYCLSQPGTRPCPHDLTLCPDCALEHCLQCILEAELNMYRTGEYDPRADPFFDHTAPPPRDRIAEDGGYWWDGSWVSHGKPRPT